MEGDTQDAFTYLSELQRHALNAMLFRTLLRGREEPLHVPSIVAVERHIPERLHPIPLELLGPLDTMRWGAWNVCQGAHRKIDLFLLQVRAGRFDRDRGQLQCEEWEADQT